MFDTVRSVVTVVALVTLSVFLFSSAKPGPKTIESEGPPEFPGRYAEFYREGEVELESYYQYVLTRRADSYIYRRFFPETKTLTQYQEYTDELLSTLHGVYEEHWDTGKPKVLGKYHYGERTGHWEVYRFDGGLQEEGSYEAGRKVGEWLAYHPNSALRSVDHYTAGDLHGTSIEYDSSGVVLSRIKYVHGDPVEEYSKPEQRDFAYNYVSEDHSIDERFKVTEKMPLFPGCRKRRNYAAHKVCADQRLLKFLYKNLQYPVRAWEYGVTGEAKVSFVIERDGSITTVRVLEGLSEDITNELIRLIGLMPRWIPGEQDGEKVRVQFNLPVRFEA